MFDLYANLQIQRICMASFHEISLHTAADLQISMVVRHDVQDE